jgi:hypothetical protein
VHWRSSAERDGHANANKPPAGGDVDVCPCHGHGNVHTHPYNGNSNIDAVAAHADPNVHTGAADLNPRSMRSVKLGSDG